MLKSLTFTEGILLKTITLVLQDVSHLSWCDLEIVPSLQHVVSVEGSPSYRSNVAIFLLNSFDFFHDFFLFQFYSIKFSHYFSHFFHIFGFGFQLSHHASNILLNLLTFQLNRVLYQTNHSLNHLSKTFG